MKLLKWAFAVMVVLNAVAFLWMGLYLGDWDPGNLDSVVRNLAEKVSDQGPLFWAVYLVGLVVFETLVLFFVVAAVVAVKGAFWSVALATLMALGLAGVKAWDIKKSVRRIEKRIEKAADKVSDPVKDAVEKVKDALP